MALKSALLSVRRFAAGIDVNPKEVRVAALSQRSWGNAPVRVESLVSVPLHPGAIAGVEIVDRGAVIDALREAFARLPRDCTSHACRCAMAMPAAATFVTSMPLARFTEQWRHDIGPHGLDALEPAVMAEAERVAGMERHSLAVDWFIDDSPASAGHLTVAMASRSHLEARVECAAAAGIMLTAIDGEPPAALRAMRHAASLRPEPHEPWAALWIGHDGVYGWRIVDDAIAAAMHYPSPEHADLAEALRDLAGGGALQQVMLGGEVALLDGVGVSVADIGNLLGGTALPFAGMSFGETAARPLDDELLHDPALVLALGLALRGIME